MAGPVKKPTAKHKPVSQISVRIPTEAEEAVMALLEEIYGQTASSYANAETGESLASCFLEASTREIKAKVPEVEAGIGRIRECGLRTDPGTIAVAPVRKEDWSESWKKFFKPLRIGQSLLVRGSWHKIPARKGRKVVVLDPGLSFGTGQHPTTSFCLGQIAAKAPRGGARSLIDMGCGSGILAIAAAKLGYGPVVAFDFDPAAVKTTLENARRNRVDQRVAASRKDLTKLPAGSRQTFDVVCANLMDHLLIAERKRILARLAPGGTLVLAGILRTQFAAVLAAFEGEGMELMASESGGEWQSGSFQRKRGGGLS